MDRDNYQSSHNDKRAKDFEKREESDGNDANSASDQQGGNDYENNYKVIDLVDAIDENDDQIPGFVVDKDIERKIVETAERIAREMFPSIAERVIREEIEKLKNED
ncbi:MAG: hypothetical protein M0P57_11450 [Syntrophales bacterium]|jgi:hypothetical protein|nr:hypothetical protein [Syntrophales bacterium]MDY0044170.1 hypothetical protein [Syntrophales bacterium]